VIVCHDHRIGFGFIRHTASKSIESALVSSMDWRQIKGMRHRMAVPPECRSYTWHTVVRHPYHRAWSEYWYFRRGLNNSKGKWVARVAQKSSFRTFIKSVLMKPSSKMLGDTQSRLCSVLDPDVILRFEDLPNCMYALPWWPEGVVLPHRNKVSPDGLHDVSERELDLIYQWAHEDFKQFGYSRDI